MEDELDTAKELKNNDILSLNASQLISQQNLKGEVLNKDIEQLQDDEQSMPITFNRWLHLIIKESFGTLSFAQLKPYSISLQRIFNTITEEHRGIRYFVGKYHQKEVRANVRKTFIPHRSIDVKEEVIPETAKLLRIENFHPEIEIANPAMYFPDQKEVMKIVEADKGNV